MGGGEMIQDVFLDHSTYAEPPGRFEAGTPAIAEAIGLGAACDYLSAIGMDVVAAHEQELGTYLYEQVRREIVRFGVHSLSGSGHIRDIFGFCMYPASTRSEDLVKFNDIRI